MKTLSSLMLWMLIYCPLAVAQIGVPELSPGSNLEQLVGYTHFEVRYGRPAARGRKIMGELVPYKKIWRTGAGKCSTIGFDREVMINGIRIPAGVYAILTIPDEEEWTVMLNRDTTKLYGDPREYDTTQEVVRLKATPTKSERYYESLTFDIDIVKYDAIIYLSWENTRIHFPIATRSHESALELIRTAVEEHPANPDILAQAAFYYYMNNEKLYQALKWLDKAISNGGDRWTYHLKADVLARQKRFEEAVQAANQGIEFLKRTKPQEWEFEVQTYQREISQWSSL